MNGWERLLTKHDLLDKHGQLLDKIRFGFSIGSTPSISFTYSPPNHKSAVDNSPAVASWIDDEASSGRLEGPFDQHSLEAILGFFRSSPLGVVEKAGSPGKFRVIRDLSFAGSAGSSINDSLDADDFLTSWGTATEIEKMVSTSPCPHVR